MNYFQGMKGFHSPFGMNAGVFVVERVEILADTSCPQDDKEEAREKEASGYKRRS